MVNAALSENGPVLPPRGAVYAQAAEISALARIATELTLAGPGCDVARAVRLLDRIRGVLGEGLDHG